jgi:ketosteroid isomerase-like protein
MTWYEDFYARVDAMDAARVAQMCTVDTTVTFANHPPAVGIEDVTAALQQLWSNLAGLKHRFVEVIEDGDRAVVEAIVDSTRRDGTTVSIPAATTILRRAGLVASQRVYIDVAPLFETAELLA